MGYDVLRTNHLGDWGTQFGMLIAELDDKFPNVYEQNVDLGDLQTFYQEAKKRFDSEPEFKQRAQENVVKLQHGDPHCYKCWQFLCDLSRQEFSRIYERLRIRIEDRGESFYNPFLQPMVDELVAGGFTQDSDGAKCIFIPKQKIPVMVQKRDGGFNYDTTDLAALRYRIDEQKADWIIYITDVGQELHFKLVWEAGKIVGYWDPAKTRLNHMGFGLVLQESQEEEKEAEEEKKGKQPKKKVEKIKTRSGKSEKLMSLLDEAKNRAMQTFEERLNPKSDAAKEGEGDATKKVMLEAHELDKAAEILGISSIKYYDLKQNRTQNYVFSYDKMLDPRGNTGVYLIYMYVRIKSILRKGGYDQDKLAELLQTEHFKITNKSERDLALTLLRLPEQIELTLSDLQLNRLCDLLYDISVKFSEFYSK